MAYQRRYEDSYLDKDDEEFEADETPDAIKLVRLIEKKDRTEKDAGRITQLTDRLFGAAKISPKTQAVEGLVNAAAAYTRQGQIDAAAALWARIADLAETIGNRDLYYEATDALLAFGPEV